jgi:hypothetical protein
MDAVSKFAEPRAWALQWEGSALAVIEAGKPEGGNGHGQPGITAQAMVWQKLDASQAAGYGPRNGNGRGAFPESRAWALAWEASALSDAGLQPETPGPIAEAAV